MPNASGMPSRKTELLTVRMNPTCKERLTSLRDVSASTAACVIIETVLAVHGATSLEEIVTKLARAATPPPEKSPANGTGTARLHDEFQLVERREAARKLRQTRPQRGRPALVLATAKLALKAIRQRHPKPRKEQIL